MKNVFLGMILLIGVIAAASIGWFAWNNQRTSPSVESVVSSPSPEPEQAAQEVQTEQAPLSSGTQLVEIEEDLDTTVLYDEDFSDLEF